MTPAIVSLRALAESPPAAVLPVEPLLTAADVGRILGVRQKRVYELGIPAVRISERSLRWSRADLANWIAERRGVA
jgi:predicted DNA-binding transcriptional regulator AlpA